MLFLSCLKMVNLGVNIGFNLYNFVNFYNSSYNVLLSLLINPKNINYKPIKLYIKFEVSINTPFPYIVSFIFTFSIKIYGILIVF